MGTTVAELFGDLPYGLDDQLMRAARDHAEISRSTYEMGRRYVGDAVATLLDIDVGALAIDAWTKYDEVREAALRSNEPGSSPQRVRLLEHQITSTHRPSIELYVDNALLTTVALDLEIELDVHGLDAEITAARLTAFRSGDLDVRATLSVEGHRLAERERSFPIGALIAVGHGIPLITSGRGPGPSPDPSAVPSPGPGHKHHPVGATHARAALAVGALLVVFVLGGVGAQVGWASFLPLQPGVAGVVRPGSEWFVRSGPFRQSPTVGTVAPGQDLRVACLERGWAELLTPHGGSYVYSRGLDLDSTPPACG